MQCRRPQFNSWVGKIPWRRERLSTPVFWPREFHGLYSPWGRKESDTTEWDTEESFLISPCYSLELCIQMDISFLSPLCLVSLFSAICKASSDNHFDFLHFFFLGVVCTMSQTSVHSSSGTLSDLIPCICHLQCITVRDLIFRSYLNGLVIFPTSI